MRLFVDGGRWYCEAISLGAEESRVFRADRIVNLVRIAWPANASEVIAKASPRFHAVSSSPMHTAVVELTYAGARKVEDHPDFMNCIVETDSGWELRFDTPESELDYFARELFALGPEARVAEPECLRERVVALLEATGLRYESARNR